MDIVLVSFDISPFSISWRECYSLWYVGGGRGSWLINFQSNPLSAVSHQQLYTSVSHDVTWLSVNRSPFLDRCRWLALRNMNSKKKKKNLHQETVSVRSGQTTLLSHPGIIIYGTRILPKLFPSLLRQLLRQNDSAVIDDHNHGDPKEVFYVLGEFFGMSQKAKPIWRWEQESGERQTWQCFWKSRCR